MREPDLTYIKYGSVLIIICVNDNLLKAASIKPKQI